MRVEPLNMKADYNTIPLDTKAGFKFVSIFGTWENYRVHHLKCTFVVVGGVLQVLQKPPFANACSYYDISRYINPLGLYLYYIDSGIYVHSLLYVQKGCMAWGSGIGKFGNSLN